VWSALLISISHSLVGSISSRATNPLIAYGSKQSRRRIACSLCADMWLMKTLKRELFAQHEGGNTAPAISALASKSKSLAIFNSVCALSPARTLLAYTHLLFVPTGRLWRLHTHRIEIGIEFVGFETRLEFAGEPVNQFEPL